jgi:hypothetical protein
MTAVHALPGAAAARAVDCRDVSAYFERADEVVGEKLAQLVEQPEFMENYNSATENSEANDEGFLSLAPEEREAVLHLMSVPADALVAIDDEDIPDAARDLHESATDRWVTMPRMMRAIAEDAPSAGMRYFDSLEAATEDNLLAQEALGSACPDEIEDYAAKAESLNASFEGVGDDPLIARAVAGAANLEGVGYAVLFFATDEDVVQAIPAS